MSQQRLKREDCSGFRSIFLLAGGIFNEEGLRGASRVGKPLPFPMLPLLRDTEDKQIGEQSRRRERKGGRGTGE